MRNLLIALGLLLAAALPASAATPLDTAYANVDVARVAEATATALVAADQAVVSAATAAVAAAQKSVFPAATLSAVVTGDAALVKAIAALSAATANLATDTAALSAAQATLKIQMTALNAAVLAADGPPPPESANLTVVPPAPTVVDAAGVSWGLTATGQITQNNAIDVRTNGVVLLAYVNHVVWQQAHNMWWGWQNNAWQPANGTAADPRVVTPPPAPAGTRNFLLGINADHVDSPTISAMLGYPPDFAEGWAGGGAAQTATGSNGGGWSPPSGPSASYPIVVTTGHFDEGVLSAADAAADNATAHAVWAQFVSKISPFLDRIYALRVDHEWQGTWYDYTPFGGSAFDPGAASYFANPKIPAAVYVAGFRNFINYIRANGFAGVKIEWDYYGTAQEATDWYPGDDVVDVVGADIYFLNDVQKTSAATWAALNSTAGQRGGGFGSLPNIAAFATAHNKPLAFPEWADGYGDGFCITQFAAWMKAHNVVFQMYWDNTNGAQPLSGVIQESAANQAAYTKAFAGLQYAGTFWTKALPVPSSLPPGF